MARRGEAQARLAWRPKVLKAEIAMERLPWLRRQRLDQPIPALPARPSRLIETGSSPSNASAKKIHVLNC